MKARILTAVALLAVAALACGVTSPPGELRVINEVGAVLDVSVWGIPAADAVPVFLPDPHYSAVLEGGQSRTWEVEPGWFYVERVTFASKANDTRAGSVVIRVADGALSTVLFYEP